MTWYLRTQGSFKIKSSPQLLNATYTIFCQEVSGQYWNISVVGNALPPKTDYSIFCHFLNIFIYFDGTQLFISADINSAH